MLKRYISFFIAAVFICSILQMPANISAKTSVMTDDQLTDILVKYGYTEGTAEALSKKDRTELVEQLIEDPSKIDIQTSIMEIDNLAEIENFLSFTNEELLSMGINQEKIITASNEINDIITKNDNQLKEEYGMDDIEVKMLRSATEKGLKIKEGKIERDTKKIENRVNASGSISETLLAYTQSVTNSSTSTAPRYQVRLSYIWKSVYVLALFDDEMVAAWGGSLNTDNISAVGYYYNWDNSNGPFTTYQTNRTMSTRETANAGIEFIFPQSLSGYSGNKPKTQNGAASFTLYQTQKQGYDTKLLSYYCHRVISFDAGIEISASGPAVSISIGSGWDTTSQKSTIISY